MTTPTPATPTARSGGHIIADALLAHGVDTAFGVPGESYLDVLDGLYERRDRIRFVICRQEGGAAFMADAYAKLTGAARARPTPRSASTPRARTPRR
jgi:acetolactate synthase-1/2/3 large subunit